MGGTITCYRSTFECCEILCIDDESTDDTPRILAKFADADPRIWVHRIEHAGLSVARNRGVELARADLVSFVDGDDVVSPRYVQALYEAYAREHVRSHGKLTMATVQSRYVLPRETPVEWPDPTDAETEVLAGDEALRRPDRHRNKVSVGNTLRRVYREAGV